MGVPSSLKRLSKLDPARMRVACDLNVMSLKMMDQRGFFILLLLCHAHGCLEIVPHTQDAVPEEHNSFFLILCLVCFDPDDFLPATTISHIDTLYFAR
jgi:hypothetical protein